MTKRGLAERQSEFVQLCVEPVRIQMGKMSKTSIFHVVWEPGGHCAIA
jgi:hypothetical protein